jgi:hypothetical protein
MSTKQKDIPVRERGTQRTCGDTLAPVSCIVYINDVREVSGTYEELRSAGFAAPARVKGGLAEWDEDAGGSGGASGRCGGVPVLDDLIAVALVLLLRLSERRRLCRLTAYTVHPCVITLRASSMLL